MSLHRHSPIHRRPRIVSAPTATLSAAALVPRSSSVTRSSLARQRPRELSPPSREPIESYTLWQPILRASDQIVLYNPASHAINIVPASLNTVSRLSLPFTNGHNARDTGVCPYCQRPMNEAPRNFSPEERASNAFGVPQIEMSPDYFQLLQDVNGGVVVEEVPEGGSSFARAQGSFARFEDAYIDDGNTPSRRWSRVSIDSDSSSDMESTDPPESLRSLSGTSIIRDTKSSTPVGQSITPPAYPSGLTARVATEEPENGRVHSPKPTSGYYSTFFREETRLGMGANGSVYLCQVCHLVLGLHSPHCTICLHRFTATINQTDCTLR